MKIGILTFHRGINAGGYLQAKSLASYLSSQEHEVEIINFVNEDQRRVNHDALFRTRHPVRLFRNFLKKRCYLNAFKELPLTRPMTSSSELAALDYDVVVFGSDEIWNIESASLGHELAFFGEGFSQSRKVSYAPSFGSTDPENPLLESFAPLLREFSSLSVRDENSVKIVAGIIGQTPQLVVDPVMLTDPDSAIRNSRNCGTIGTYLMGPSSRDVERIRAFAKMRGQKLCSVGFYESWADHKIASADPRAIPGLLKGCDLVVTNTFHGVMFCLKNAVPFLIISHPSKNQKIDTFRRRLNLKTVWPETTIIDNDLINDPEEHATKILEWVSDSKAFLNAI